MNKARRFVIETSLGKLEAMPSTIRAIVRKTIPASLSTLYARMVPRSCWHVWSMIRTKICSRQSSMAIAHRTSQPRLLNTTTLILKNEGIDYA